MSRSDGTVLDDRTARAIRRGLTAVVFIVAGLSFSFGLGNGWQFGVLLGVPGWIAPLVAPAVDLSVVALLASMQYLRANGVEGRLLGPRLLLVFCGLVTLALNTAHPVLAGEYGRACFDAVAPLLLIGWSEVGPKLLAALHRPGTNVPGSSPAVPDDGTVVPLELLATAKLLDSGRGSTWRMGLRVNYYGEYEPTRRRSSFALAFLFGRPVPIAVVEFRKRLDRATVGRARIERKGVYCGIHSDLKCSNGNSGSRASIDRR